MTSKEAEKIDNDKITIIKINTKLLFVPATDQLSKQGMNMINSIISKIKSYNGSVIAIECHTDGGGSNKYNQQLSKKRAMAVAKTLKEKYGITAEMFGDHRTAISKYDSGK